MFKGVIFDLDGTLVDAYKAIEKSLNFTLKLLGYPPASASAVRSAVGFGDVNFIKRFVKEKDVEAALRIYRRHHKNSLIKYSCLKKDARKALAGLKRKGFKLAVASNRPLKFSNILLRHLGLKRYFDMVLCPKDKSEFKPKPKLLLRIMREFSLKKSEVLYVGDMSIDVYAAKNAGIRAVAMTGGSSSKSELKKAGPFKIISGLNQLLKIVYD